MRLINQYILINEESFAEKLYKSFLKNKDVKKQVQPPKNPPSFGIPKGQGVVPGNFSTYKYGEITT